MNTHPNGDLFNAAATGNTLAHNVLDTNLASTPTTPGVKQLDSAIEIPPEPGTPAPARERKKAAEASAIKLLPKFIQAWRWGHKQQMLEVSEAMAEAIQPHFPKIAKAITDQSKMEMKPVAVMLPEGLLTLEHARHGLDQVILPTETELACRAIIQEHWRSEDLQAFGLAPRHKVLLHGTPGNGKTLLAEALARELDVPFLRVKYSGLMTSYLGETGKNLDRIMEYAKTAPCVLFLDEFDGVGLERNSLDVGEMRRVTNQLLISMERLPSTCLFVAATNVHSQIDGALRRRFDFTIEIPSPTLALKLRCAQKELRPELTPGHDLMHFCERVANCTTTNLFEVVELCRRLRRDLVLNDGEGLEAILQGN